MATPLSDMYAGWAVPHTYTCIICSCVYDYEVVLGSSERALFEHVTSQRHQRAVATYETSKSQAKITKYCNECKPVADAQVTQSEEQEDL